MRLRKLISDFQFTTTWDVQENLGLVVDSENTDTRVIPASAGMTNSLVE
jgi:hypothetical protein